MQCPLAEKTCCLICSLTSSFIGGQPVIPETLCCSTVMSWQRSKGKQNKNPSFILLPKCITLLFLQVAKACLTGGDWDNYDEARKSLMFPFLNGNHCCLSPNVVTFSCCGSDLLYSTGSFFQNPTVFLQLPYITYILESPSLTEEFAAERLFYFFAESAGRPSAV